MLIDSDTVLMRQVPSAAFVNIDIGKGETKGIHRWVNLAVIKSVVWMQERNEIHLYPLEGMIIKISDPESVKAVLGAIASYSIQPA